jgi:hypothetical protein
MTLYPGAINMLIPESGSQPRIRPRALILHTNASNTSIAGAASLMARSDQEFHWQMEAPGTGRVAGRLAQFVDTTTRADNNFRGNSWEEGGVLYGCCSCETADHGSPYEKSWTDLGQRDALEDLCVWYCQTHNIPPVRPVNPWAPGIGYHAMWGYNVASSTGSGTYGVYTAPDGRRAHLNNPWTNALGKICPGPGKIREYPDLLAAVARRVAGGAEEEPVTPAEIEAVAKRSAQLVWDQLIDNVADPTKPDVPARSALAYTLRNTAASYLGEAPGDVTVQGHLTSLSNEVAELRQVVENLQVGGGTVDVAAIAEAVADEMANRLEE